MPAMANPGPIMMDRYSQMLAMSAVFGLPEDLNGEVRSLVLVTPKPICAFPLMVVVYPTLLLVIRE